MSFGEVTLEVCEECANQITATLSKYSMGTDVAEGAPSGFRDFKFTKKPRCIEAEQKTQRQHIIAALGLDPYLMDEDIRNRCEQERLILRERLAAYAHEAWRQWAMVILPDAERAVVDHRKLRTVNRTGESHMEYGPCECRLCQRVARWRALLVPYAELPEAEKESDREQADRILAILSGKERT